MTVTSRASTRRIGRVLPSADPVMDEMDVMDIEEIETSAARAEGSAPQAVAIAAMTDVMDAAMHLR